MSPPPSWPVTSSNTARTFCANVLAKFKIPRIIEFVPEVPKTLSGKIRRIDLRKYEITSKDKGARGQHEYFYQELSRFRP